MLSGKRRLWASMTMGVTLAHDDEDDEELEEDEEEERREEWCFTNP